MHYVSELEQTIYYKENALFKNTKLQLRMY
jgi:hypothetical protein